MRKAKLAKPQSAAATVQAARNAVAAWRPTLGLDDWRVCVWAAPGIDDAFAEAMAEPKYKILHITVFAERMLEHGFSVLQIESVMVHEMVHALAWTLANEVANPAVPDELRSFFEETHVEEVTQALLRAKYNNDPELRNLWNACGAKHRPTSDGGDDKWKDGAKQHRGQ